MQRLSVYSMDVKETSKTCRAFSVHNIGNLSSLLGFLSWQKKKIIEMVIHFQVHALTSFPTFFFFHCKWSGLFGSE